MQVRVKVKVKQKYSTYFTFTFTFTRIYCGISRTSVENQAGFHETNLKGYKSSPISTIPKPR